MVDRDGHDLQINDIVRPDNDSYQLQINAFDGTVCTLTPPGFASAQLAPPYKFLPAHLVFLSRP